MSLAVVVLGDDRRVRDLICQILTMSDLTAVGVAHPAQLDDVLSQTQPSAFLIDVMLQETSGIEVASRLRTEGYGTVPMIAMSASNLMNVVAAESGLFQAILNKPFEVDHLVSTVKQYVDEEPEQPLLEISG
jgi:CheY-like chemotaxis protein